MVALLNPYWEKDFWQFFQVLFGRLWNVVQGQTSQELATDEIQLLVLLAISVGCSLIGNFLVLRKMTMLANSLSHTTLLGIVGAQVGWAFFLRGSVVAHGQPAFLSPPILLIASLLSALMTAWLTRLITRKARLDEGAGIGLVFTTLFALGLVSLTLFNRDSHIGTEVVMGNIDALHRDDIALSWMVTGVDIFAMILLYRVLKITSFDLPFARALGLPCQVVDALFIFLTAATVIGSFRAVGVLLVLAYLTGPALTARLVTHRLFLVIAVSILFSSFSSIMAVALSRHLLTVYDRPVSTAGLAVVLIAALFIVTFLSTFLFATFTRYRQRAILPVSIK
jgi:manganese/zinc/iron transport system permease protein